MKAAIYTNYGFPEVIHVTELEKPKPKAGEVLVKILAASVNNWDIDLVKGRPYIYRFFSGIFKPRYKIIGSDIAGIVEAVGENVADFKPGDEVFGDISENGFGAFAEYAAIPQNLLAKKLTQLSFEEAASIPQAGFLALQGLLKNGEPKKNSKILINGAGGGAGTLAVQIAKLFGAEVTGVDSKEKFEVLKSLGTDFVINYREEDFTQSGKKYDLIVDNILKKNPKDCKKVLTENGNYVVLGGSVKCFLKVALFHQWRNKGKQIKVLPYKPNRKDLEKLNELIENKKIKPIIDKIYKLEQLPDAITQLIEGKATGKLIITMQ